MCLSSCSSHCLLYLSSCPSHCLLCLSFHWVYLHALLYNMFIFMPWYSLCLSSCSSHCLLCLSSCPSHCLLCLSSCPDIHCVYFLALLYNMFISMPWYSLCLSSCPDIHCVYLHALIFIVNLYTLAIVYCVYLHALIIIVISPYPSHTYNISSLLLCTLCYNKPTKLLLFQISTVWNNCTW